MPNHKPQNTHQTAIVLFLKYPEKGKVKTRLADTLGDELTLELYTAFITDMGAKLNRLPYPLYFFISPGKKVEAAKDFFQAQNVYPQEGEHLGLRMKHAFETIFSLGFEYCILMGSDFPDLPPKIPGQAADALKTNDAVIGPTKDGGYYLIGFQRKGFCPGIFTAPQICWGTNTVYQDTLEILLCEGVKTKRVLPWQDVDVIADLKEFYSRNLDSPFQDSTTMKILRKHHARFNNA